MQVRRRRYDRTVLVPGQTLTGRESYRVGDLIGEGGFAIVYEATSPRGEPIALKEFIPPDTIEEREVLRESYRLERDVLWDLRADPHLPHLLDAFSQDGMDYLALELIQGPSLQEQLNRREAISPESAGPLAIQLAHALASLHARGFVHHDVKPSNMKFRPGGLAVLLDLGSARFIGSYENGAPKVATPVRAPWLFGASDGDVTGTEGHIAPELFEMAVAGHIVSYFRFDVFAFGCTMAELVAGHMLDQAEINARNEQYIADLVKEVSARCPELGPPLARALSLDADERYPSAQELLADLQQAVPPRLTVRENELVFDLTASRGPVERQLLITNAGGGTLRGVVRSSHRGIALRQADGSTGQEASFEGSVCLLRAVVEPGAPVDQGQLVVTAGEQQFTVACKVLHGEDQPVRLLATPSQATLVVTQRTTQRLNVTVVNQEAKAATVLAQTPRPDLLQVSPAECRLGPNEKTTFSIAPTSHVLPKGIHDVTVRFQAGAKGVPALVRVTLQVRATLWHQMMHGLRKPKE